MRNIILLLVILLKCISTTLASDSLMVWMNKTHFKHNDTIQIETTLQKLNSTSQMQSVMVVVQNVESKKTWQFRYPLINGFAGFDFLIDSLLPNGNYAITILLNPQFYTIKGTVQAGLKKSKALKYTLLTKNNNGLVDILNLDDKNKFTLKNLVYPDTAFILFSTQEKKRWNNIDIDIATPLDSAFKPSFVNTTFITIGNADTLQLQQISKNYNWQKNIYKNTGEIVTVIGKSNAKLNKFEKDNISAAFKSFDEIVIDGLSTDELSNAPDLFTYLTTKIPGLQNTTNAQDGMPSLLYRKEKVVIYLNELKLADDDFPNINTDDIALVKFFRSNALLTNGSSAVLAIYTKGINDYAKPKNKYSFKIMGYHQQLNILK